MVRQLTVKWIPVCLLAASCCLVSASAVTSQDMLRYCCSNQVYAAFSKEHVESFTEISGIKVDLKTASSASCVYSLGRGFWDIASSARKLYRRHESYGYSEFAFCKDPIAVIAKEGCGVENLTEEQLEDIFAGDITNWKEVGGVDSPIMVVAPDRGSAAFKNFSRQVMKNKEIEYEFMAYTSTMVIEAIKYFPCGSISFISRGAAFQHPEIKLIKVNGRSPRDDNYPYHQIFYYVTKGAPTGSIKSLIDYTYSEEGARIIQKHGMIPIAR
jgi:phosphate transport system substrate-binding protein